MSDQPRNHPDIPLRSPSGQEFAVRMEGPITAAITHDDGSVLEIVQDANGERQYRVSPWPPADETEKP